MHVAERAIPTTEEGSLKVQNSRATQSMRVTTDGKNLVSHAGTALLSELADRSGLTEAMSAAMAGCGINWHTHDPGVVLTHLAVAIADGAWVTELTDLMPLSAWPEDTRLLMRRERPHPGAQLTLFDTAEGFRHTCFITNTEVTDI